MPELPEVETVRLNLVNLVKNKTITKVDVLDKRIPSTSKLDLSLLNKQTIINIHRLGKYLFFEFNDYILISHLRMEGKYYYYEDEEESTHARVIFYFNDNTKLIYDDVRRFGTMELFTKDNIYESKVIKTLGKEPFSHTVESLYPLLNKSNLPIKTALLDQHIISGIGNIYADEILYDCKISPFKKASEITKEETLNIINSSIKILNDAISLGGSTIKSYHPGRNIDGKFQQNLKVYNNAGNKCEICNSKILKTFLGGRGTSYCPHCQNVGKIIGIYGKIASGKSTLLSYFKEDNFPVFSADDEVANIYKNDIKFTAYCVHHFGEACLNEHNKVNKEFIKQVLFSDRDKIKILEDYLHPEVKNRAINFIKKNRNSKLIILEIPLLFESKMDTMCDYIVGLDVTLDIQIKNLNRRNSKNVSMDLLINSTSKFDKVVDKLDYIIHNLGTLDDLKNEYIKTKNALLSI